MLYFSVDYEVNFYFCKVSPKDSFKVSIYSLSQSSSFLERVSYVLSPQSKKEQYHHVRKGITYLPSYISSYSTVRANKIPKIISYRQLEVYAKFRHIKVGLKVLISFQFYRNYNYSYKARSVGWLTYVRFSSHNSTLYCCELINIMLSFIPT